MALKVISKAVETVIHSKPTWTFTGNISCILENKKKLVRIALKTVYKYRPSNDDLMAQTMQNGLLALLYDAAGMHGKEKVKE